MNSFLLVFAATFSLEVAIILMLALLPRLGGLGKDLLESFTKAPWLDVILSVMLWVPWLISGLIDGASGIFAALVAQITALQLWCALHELAHRQTTAGCGIARFHNQRLGWWRNNLALWVTSVVVPVFFLIRFAEIFVYPWLTWLLGFPKYNHSEWVNVSRQKFQGLIGKDLIWCLYCDWMTGVYSLGAEMLRNVESFWCPIRFYDGKKCENCKIDFPDIEGGWIAAEGSMNDVEQVLVQKYSDREQSWFGHPERQAKSGKQ
ncbi:hypothetical protein [Oscillatoria sp. FACHB-1406]|uniref:hypothetical protein n=1 Tax=Oscillatoria sp. FACHB-1406 TaxID=2692846 RepID=UPI001686D710|nr:hypothetical protein [Oscillatoria sp. FACHB-1406]MBD2577653.1 hypothetical protein [Oscillatoria sp. FACHB-1406]